MTKLSDGQLLKLVDKGHTQSNIAKQFGVARSTINRRIKLLNQATTSAVIVNDALNDKVDGDLNLVAQLKELNKRCWKMLDEAKESGEKLATSREIREGLKLYLDIVSKVYDIEMVQAFQTAVMEALDETDPVLKREAIRRINAKREMRGVAIL